MQFSPVYRGRPAVGAGIYRHATRWRYLCVRLGQMGKRLQANEQNEQTVNIINKSRYSRPGPAFWKVAFLHWFHEWAQDAYWDVIDTQRACDRSFSKLLKVLLPDVKPTLGANGPTGRPISRTTWPGQEAKEQLRKCSIPTLWYARTARSIKDHSAGLRPIMTNIRTLPREPPLKRPKNAWA